MPLLRAPRPSLLLLFLLSLVAASAIAASSHDGWGDADDDADDDEFDGHDASAAPGGTGARSSADLAPTPPPRGVRRKGTAIPAALAVDRSFVPGDSNSFLPGGLVMMQGVLHGDDTTWVDATVIWHPLTAGEAGALKALVAADGEYRVRLAPNPFSAAPPPQGHVIAWGRARCLAAAGFRDSLHLLFDAGGRLISAHVKAQADCSPAATAALDVDAVMAVPLIVLNSDVTIHASTIAQRLPVRTAPVGGGAVGAGGAAGGGVGGEEDPMAPPVPPKTFWQKYWVFIMAGGLLVLNVFTALAGPDAPPAAQGGGAAGGGGGGGGGGGRRA